MICPVCKSEMIVVEYNKIELDYCTGCKGAWFDSGELELLLGSMGLEGSHLFLDNIIGSTEAGSSEKKRKCPICHKDMKKITIGRQPEILIDVCQREDGLWFDSDEVAHLVRQLAEKQLDEPGSQQKLIRFLGEVFKA